MSDYDLIEYQNGFAMLCEQMGIPKDATFARMRQTWNEVLSHSCEHEQARDKAEKQLAALRDVVVRVRETGKAGLILSESCGPDGLYQVVAKFHSLKEMQAFYGALADLATAADREGSE